MNLLKRIQHRLVYGHLPRIVRPYTLVDPDRIRSLCSLARRVESEKIPGDVVECGVCNGGTAAILAHFATRSKLGRTVWLLDSFQGMPEPTGNDGESAREHVGKEVGDPARVQEVLRLVGARMDRVRIVPGWFDVTFPTLSIPKIALLNIDADWYESVKLCLETFYDRVVPGGFISLDDYGYWPGCRKAVDEFFDSRRLPYTLNWVDYTGRWFRKG
jgi:O-methyltransferase